MAAAKKPAKKVAKSGNKSAKKALKKVVKKVAAAPKTKKAGAKGKGPGAAHKAKAVKPLKSASVVKKSAVAPKGATSAKGAKAPMPLKPGALPVRRGGRPARASKEQRQIPPMPAPGLTGPTTVTVAPKLTPAPSPKALAAAHEYLLARSATRSEAPVVVNGKRLPTEEQLLKTRDSDYMNEEQLAYFKHRLQQMEGELLQNADETTEHLRESVIVPDPADRATIEEEHALELRTRDRERKLLKKVQQALARVESGEYGYCEETGEPIGIPRLLARPTATLSLEAQQRREMKQKMFGD